MQPDQDNVVFMQRLAQSQQDLLHYVQAALFAYPDDVWDVVQDTNLALISHAAEYVASRPFLAWAFGFARKQIALFRLKKGREKIVFDESMLDLYEKSAFAVDAEENPYAERIRHLHECLARLPERQRSLLDLHYLKDETLVSIAKRQKKQESAVHMAIFRARQALADCMKRLCRMNGDSIKPEEELSPFQNLLVEVIDAPDLDRCRVSGLFDALCGSPENMNAYSDQVNVHFLLKEDAQARKTGRRSAALRRTLWTAVAAAAVALLAGGALLLRRGEPSRVLPVVPVAESRRAPIAVGCNREQTNAIEKTVFEPRRLAEQPPEPKTAIAAVPASSSVVVKNHTIAVAKPQKKEKEKPMNIASIKSSAVTTAAVATVALLTSAQKAALAASESNVPVVSNVTFKQPFGTRTLEIGYTLSNGPGIVTVDITTNGVSIGDANVTFLKGEVNKVVQDGTYSVLWDTRKAWPNHTNEQTRAVVTAWATNCPPDYMVVDLIDGTNIQYYTSAEALPAGGLTNAIYRTACIVMRKISAAGVPWVMGARGELTSDAANETPHNVTLTNDYYIGVFEFTQGQWANIKGNWPSYWNNIGDAAGRPVEQVSYNTIRGSATTSYYPADPAADSFLGLLRTKTGLAFDLPDEAQWEYACRAGNYEGKWGDGNAITAKSALSDANLDLLGRYQYNGGKIGGTSEPAPSCGATNGTAIVGSYRPNSWGLYDMHGNVWEWCLDLYAADISSLNGAVNTNPASGSNRVLRSGSWGADARNCRSAKRHNDSPSGSGNGNGFRPALALGL